jgi:hypothetical protein
LIFRAGFEPALLFFATLSLSVKKEKALRGKRKSLGAFA